MFLQGQSIPNGSDSFISFSQRTIHYDIINSDHLHITINKHFSLYNIVSNKFFSVKNNNNDDDDG